jgi:hypothetical protein
MDANDPDLKDFVQSLGRAPLAALCGLLGLAPRAGVAAVCARAAERCSTPDGVLALLKSIKEDELDLLLCWAIRGPQGLARAQRWAPRLSPDPVPGSQWHLAHAGLAARGLCAPGDNAIDMLPCLRETLAPIARAREMKQISATGEGEAPLGFCLAVATGLAASERLLVRGDGELYATSSKRIEKRLGSTGLAGLSPEAALHVLTGLGVLTLRDEGGSRLLGVEASALAPVFGLDPEALAHRALWGHGGASTELWTLARLRFAAGAARAKGEARGATLDAIAAARIPSPHASGRWSPLDSPDPWDLLASLRTLLLAGLAEASPDGQELRFRPRLATAHGAAHAVVQPSFDVLVPWDAPPLQVARLGLFADLEQMDRVCRYRLSPASVGRGSELLGGGAAILAHLEELSGAALPQNVRVTLAGWAGSQSPVRAAQGEVLVTTSPEQVQVIRRHAPTARDLAPGVLLLPPGSLKGVVAALRKAGFPVAPALQASEGNVAPRAPKEVASRVASYLAGATREAPEVKAPAAEPRRGLRSLDPYVRAWAPLDDEDEDGYEDGDEDEDDEDQGARGVGAGSGAEKNPSGSKPPWFPLEGERPARRDAPTGDADPPTWNPILPGALRALLEDSIALQRPLRVLFRNSEGRSVDRLIRPLRLQRTPKGDTLDALDTQHGGACTLVLERILAVAGK